MSAHSRAKGSRFERAIAHDLHALTGIAFARNLEQVRTAAHGDLVPDDPAWPFSLELKARADAKSCLTAWKAQAANAAALCGKLPAVIFKADRQPVRVALPFSVIAAAFGASVASDDWAEITLPGLATIAAEIMAAKAQAAT